MRTSTQRVDLRTIEPRHPFEAGPFTVEPIRVTHSTPDSIALAIRTPAGIIVHSGDFKIDDAPVDGALFDRERFAELGDEGVAVLLSDSTNVERAGTLGLGKFAQTVLRELTSRTRGRFFLSAFSSHLHRIRQVVEVSREFGRRVVPLGTRDGGECAARDRDRPASVCRQAIFIEPGEAEFIDAAADLSDQRQPGRAVLRVGETCRRRSSARTDRARRHGRALVALHSRQRAHRSTLSSISLYRQGADVVLRRRRSRARFGPREPDELADLIALMRPRHFVPIHGEYRHLSRHVALAIAAGIPEHNCFLLEDGDSLVLSGGEARRGRNG